MGGYVDIAGHSMWVEDTGSGDEAVLLLHGGLSSCGDLLGTIGPSLAERYRVVAFDRDDDAVRLDHTCALFEALQNGQLAIVPAASHLLPIEKPLVSAQLVSDFLGQDGPPATFMPIRRRG